MKPIIIVLTTLFLALQYKLWFEQGGVTEVWSLQQAISAQVANNSQMTERNTILAAEVEDLKSGQAAVEERARDDLGMIKPDEVFYQIVSPTSNT